MLRSLLRPREKPDCVRDYVSRRPCEGGFSMSPVVLQLIRSDIKEPSDDVAIVIRLN